MGICASQDLPPNTLNALSTPRRPPPPSQRPLPPSRQPLETVALPAEPPSLPPPKHSLFLSEQQSLSIPQAIHPMLAGTLLQNPADVQLLIYENEELVVQAHSEPHVRAIKKHRTEIGEPQLLVLLQARWINLSRLGINRSSLGNRGCKWLSRVSLPALEKLGLRENEIEGEGIIHLSKMSCPRLAQLYLAGNRISLGLKRLLQVSMPNIIYINLENNMIMGLEIDFVLVSRMPHLELIDLTWNRIEDMKEKERRKKQFTQRYYWGHILQC